MLSLARPAYPQATRVVVPAARALDYPLPKFPAHPDYKRWFAPATDVWIHAARTRFQHHPLIMDVGASQRDRKMGFRDGPSEHSVLSSFPPVARIGPVMSPFGAPSTRRHRALPTPDRARPSHFSSTTPLREFSRKHRPGPIRRNLDNMCCCGQSCVGCHPMAAPSAQAADDFCKVFLP